MKSSCGRICVALFAILRAVVGMAEDAPTPLGWASVGQLTTGGAGGAVYRVATVAELERALAAAAPRLIEITSEIRLEKAARIPSDTTIAGVTKLAKITGDGLHVRRAQNVIISNLVISQAGDAISIEESQYVWIDHCDLSACRDGLIDIKRGSDFVTVSWNHLHDHQKTCLLGHSDKDSIREIDRGHLRATYHHNFFDGTKTRHPRVRFADGVHVFNNHFRGNEYGVASVMDAGVIVESNIFEDVEQPTLTAYGDSPLPGRLVASNNLLIRSGAIQTRGEVEIALPYRFAVDLTDTLADVLSQKTGPQFSVDVTPSE